LLNFRYTVGSEQYTSFCLAWLLVVPSLNLQKSALRKEKVGCSQHLAVPGSAYNLKLKQGGLTEYRHQCWVAFHFLHSMDVYGICGDGQKLQEVVIFELPWNLKASQTKEVVWFSSKKLGKCPPNPSYHGQSEVSQRSSVSGSFSLQHPTKRLKLQ